MRAVVIVAGLSISEEKSLESAVRGAASRGGTTDGEFYANCMPACIRNIEILFIYVLFLLSSYFYPTFFYMKYFYYVENQR